MMYRSHAIMGMSSGIATAGALSTPLTAQGIIIISLCGVLGYAGSLIPDIDHHKAFISQKLKFTLIPWLISSIFAHRGFTHSLVFMFMVGASLLFTAGSHGSEWLNDIYIYAIIAGIAAHSLGDIFTTGGVKLFYPLPLMVSVSPMRTGSHIEFFVATLISLVMIVLSWNIMGAQTEVMAYIHAY